MNTTKDPVETILSQCYKVAKSRGYRVRENKLYQEIEHDGLRTRAWKKKSPASNILSWENHSCPSPPRDLKRSAIQRMSEIDVTDYLTE
jgi:hypothetical protein